MRTGERTLEAAAYTALQALGDVARHQLDHSGMNPAVLDVRNPTWQAQINRHLLPAVAAVFVRGFTTEDRTPALTAAAQPAEAHGAAPAPTYADQAADRYLSQIRNRLAGVADTVFDQITTALTEGRNAVSTYTDPLTGEELHNVGESIPQLSARVDALLSDTQRWKARATTIARTETIGANNAGSHAAASHNAGVLGYSDSQVQKTWLATNDSSTRETHAEADGQIVMGMSTPFQVGDSQMEQPGDPDGDPEETINCRCTALYAYPGDPDYQGAAVAASASLYPQTAPPLHTHGVNQEDTMTTMADDPTAAPPPADAPAAPPADDAGAQTSVIVCALPAADDPVNSIDGADGGGDGLHATMLYFGDVGTGDQPNPGLTDAFQATLIAAVQAAAAMSQPFTDTVTGVESLGDDGARVWVLDPGSLEPIRNAVISADPSIADVMGQVTQFPKYTPHVTIAFPPDAPADAEDVTDDDAPDSGDAAPDAPVDTTLLDDATEAAAAAVTSIQFDRLAIWWAGDQTEYPLTAEGDTPAHQQPAAQPGDAAATLRQISGLLQAAGLTVVAADDPTPPPAPEDVPAAPPVVGPAAQDIAADGDPFYGILWPEGVQSGDGRAVDPQATTWRDLPLSLMVQVETAMGHDGSVRAGRLDTIERDETTYAVPVIRYTGVWDTSDVAVEAERQVDNRVLKGLSVDGVAVTIELRGSTGQVLDPMFDPFPEDGIVIEVATAAQVGGATACSIPAFQQAYIANGTFDARVDPEPGWNDDGTAKDAAVPPAVASAPDPGAGEQPVGGEDFDEPVTAGARAWTLVASAGQTWDMPVWPYSDFANPELADPTRLTVTDDGRVFGHLATWGVCHIGIDGICQEPPVSATNYAYFATGKVETTEGFVAVGQLTMDTGHPSLYLSGRDATAHYDNTGTAVADVAIGQDGVGIWFAGRIRPGTTPEQVYALRATGSVSGDWRPQGTGLELFAALVVNVNGFPIPHTAVAASAAGVLGLVAAGIVRPDPVSDPAPGTFDTAALVAQVVATLDRRARAHAASARLRKTRVSAAAARLNRKG